MSPDVGEGRYLDHNLKPVVLGAWAGDQKNREAVWGKMKNIIGEA